MQRGKVRFAEIAATSGVSRSFTSAVTSAPERAADNDGDGKIENVPRARKAANPLNMRRASEDLRKLLERSKRALGLKCRA